MERSPLYEKFFELSLDLFAIATHDGYFSKVNPALMLTLGYTEEELVSKPLTSFIHPDDVPSTLREMNLLLDGFPTVYFVNRYRCKDGSYKTLAWKATPDPDGYVYAAARDITAQKEQEDSMRAAIVNAQDDERQRIAQELHDGICQSMVAMQLNFQTLKPKEEHLLRYYDTARNLIKDSIGELRNFAHNMAPPELQSNSLTTAIRSLAERTSILSGIEIRYICQVKEAPDMPFPFKLNVYRVVQEFFLNSIKHSGCSLIEVQCYPQEDQFVLRLSDNGVGFEFEKSLGKGAGIANMITRIQMLSGSLEVDNEKQQGAALKIILPNPTMVPGYLKEENTSEQGLLES